MIHLHSGYIFGKYVSEGIKPQPLPPNIFYENGIFNSLYIPNDFNILTNRKSINQGPPYYPSTGTWYHILDYNLGSFTYPNGSLADGSTFNLKIYNDNYTQQELSIMNTSINISHIRPVTRINQKESAFTGLIIPVKDFVSFLNMSPYSYRAIYVRYRIIQNDQVYRGRFLNGEVGYQNSSTSMLCVKSNLNHHLGGVSVNEWHDQYIWSTMYKGHNIDLDPSYSYFLKFGFVTEMNSYQQEIQSKLEIIKIWSDEWSDEYC